MAVTDEQFKALSDEVKALSDGMPGVVANAVTEALKPVLDAQAEQAKALANQQEAELADLRAKIVKANLLDEAAAGELTLNAARALAKAAVPGKAAPIANGVTLAPDNTTGGFKLPKMEA